MVYYGVYEALDSCIFQSKSLLVDAQIIFKNTKIVIVWE